MCWCMVLMLLYILTLILLIDYFPYYSENSFQKKKNKCYKDYILILVFIKITQKYWLKQVNIWVKIQNDICHGDIATLKLSEFNVSSFYASIWTFIVYDM